MFPEALPPYAPCVARKMSEAPWASQEPTYRRAAETEENRQQRSSVKTARLSTGQRAAHYLRYIAAAEIARSRHDLGGMRETLTNSTHCMALTVAQNMETASRFEKVRSTAWKHLVRDRGNLGIVEEDPVKLNRDRLNQRAADERSEYRGRAQPETAYPPPRPIPSRRQAWDRPNSQKSKGGPQWARTRRDYSRAASPPASLGKMGRRRP